MIIDLVIIFCLDCFSSASRESSTLLGAYFRKYRKFPRTGLVEIAEIGIS